MKRQSWRLYLVVFLLFLSISLPCIAVEHPSQSRKAKIKKKSGQIVEGEIWDKILIKESVQQSAEGSKTVYLARYIEIDGWGVQLIDETGFRVPTERVTSLLIAWTENAPPSDIEIFEGRDDSWRKINGFGLKRLKDGVAAFVSDPFWPERLAVDTAVRFAESQFGDKGASIARMIYEQQKLFVQEHAGTLTGISSSPVSVFTGKLIGQRGVLVDAIELDVYMKNSIKVPLAEIVEVKQKAQKM